MQQDCTDLTEKIQKVSISSKENQKKRQISPVKESADYHSGTIKDNACSNVKSVNTIHQKPKRKKNDNHYRETAAHQSRTFLNTMYRKKNTNNFVVEKATSLSSKNELSGYKKCNEGNKKYNTATKKNLAAAPNDGSSEKLQKSKEYKEKDCTSAISQTEIDVDDDSLSKSINKHTRQRISNKMINISPESEIDLQDPCIERKEVSSKILAVKSVSENVDLAKQIDVDEDSLSKSINKHTRQRISNKMININPESEMNLQNSRTESKKVSSKVLAVKSVSEDVDQAKDNTDFSNTDVQPQPDVFEDKKNFQDPSPCGSYWQKENDNQNSLRKYNGNRSFPSNSVNTHYNKYEMNQRFHKNPNRYFSNTLESKQNKRRSTPLISMDKQRSNTFSQREENDFQNFKVLLNKNHLIECNYIMEIEGDLFHASDEYSLAHCVAEDFHMGSGIAVIFREKFNQVSSLLQQNQRQGGLAVLENNKRFIYYLVTKIFSTGKPNLETLFKSLKKMKNHILKHHVKKLAIPRLGCGLDRLNWDDVKFMLNYLFEHVDIEIHVYSLTLSTDNIPTPTKFRKMIKTYVDHIEEPLTNLPSGLILLYFTNENGQITSIMTELNLKFPFLKHFEKQNKRLGHIVIYDGNNDFYVVGCIVKQNNDYEYNYEALENCAREINQQILCEESLLNVAFQAEDDPTCRTKNHKLINILTYTLHCKTLNVCWPGQLKKIMPFIKKGRQSL